MENDVISVTRGDDGLLRCTPCNREIQPKDMFVLIRIAPELIYNPVCPECSTELLTAASTGLIVELTTSHTV